MTPARAPTAEGQEFLSLIAHELKTPLTIIKGYAATLRRSLDDSETGQMAADIEQEADRVTRLVNQLLDVTRIEGGRLDLRPRSLEVVELLEDVVRRFRSAEPARHIAIEAPAEDLVVSADESALKNVFDIVLSNACRYSAPPEPIVVTVRGDGTTVEVTVRDRGAGIPEQDLPRVTEKLFRAANACGDGLGLGLYIAARLLDLQGGRLEAQSVLGEGSSFAVILSAQRSAEQ